MIKQITLLSLSALFLAAPLFAQDASEHPYAIASKVEDYQAHGHTGQKHGPTHGSKPARAAVLIDPETIQNIGVRTEKVEKHPFGLGVRSYGMVTENVRIQYDISSRIEGWIEDLKVTAVGDEVQKGDFLFDVYSPDLISAQQDFVTAQRSGIGGRARSAEKRLLSLGVQQQVVGTLRKNLKVLENVPFYAEESGVISEINVSANTYVKPGMTIAKIQDYSSVWINVSVAEEDLPKLTDGGNAKVSFPKLGNRDRTATIDYIYPTVDKATRTGQVRLVLDNADGELKPGAYADIEFQTDVRNRLSVPIEAVLRSSDGDYVIVAKGNGRFQPRKIETGVPNKDLIEVVSGVREGEEIVVSAQFLIDSESKLKESFLKFTKVNMPLSLLEVSHSQMEELNHLVDAAIYLQQTINGAVEYNPAKLQTAISLSERLSQQFAGTKLQEVAEEATSALKKATTETDTTALQEPLAQLIKALQPWLLEGQPQYFKDKGLLLYMDHPSGSHWVQLEKAPSNPYGNGHAMIVEWPDLSEMKMEEAAPAPMGGGHAGH